MKDLSKDILSKIKKKDIKPKPKWHFLMKERVLWGIFAFSILLGGVAVSVIFFQVMTNEWDIAERISGSFTYFLFISLPYFWILIMGGFSFLSYHYLRKTKKGYKYSLLSINLVSISASIVLGTILFMTGMSFHINRIMHDNMPMYDQMMSMHHDILSDPENGVVIGKIIEVKSDYILLVQNRGKGEWRVDISKVEKMPPNIIKEGNRIIAIGKKEDKTIYADIIKSGDRVGMGGMPFFDKENSRPMDRKFNRREQ